MVWRHAWQPTVRMHEPNPSRALLQGASLLVGCLQRASVFTCCCVCAVMAAVQCGDGPPPAAGTSWWRPLLPSSPAAVT